MTKSPSKTNEEIFLMFTMYINRLKYGVNYIPSMSDIRLFKQFRYPPLTQEQSQYILRQYGHEETK